MERNYVTVNLCIAKIPTKRQTAIIFVSCNLLFAHTKILYATLKRRFSSQREHP